MKRLLLSPFIFALLLVSSFSQTVAPPNKSASQPVITFDKDNCLCPAYSARIYADGTVIYQGQSGVRVMGRRRYKISREKVKELIDEFQRINYFPLKDFYFEPGIEDGGTVTTSILINGQRKTVNNSGGDSPKELVELEKKIEEILELYKYTNTIKISVAEFSLALRDNPAASGFIINYGTAPNIANRLGLIKKALIFGKLISAGSNLSSTLAKGR